MEDLGLRLKTPRDSHAAIVVFEYRDPYGLAEKLSSRGIIISPRPGIIRVSPHLYNTIEEIEIFLEQLKKNIKTSGA